MMMTAYMVFIREKMLDSAELDTFRALAAQGVGPGDIAKQLAGPGDFEMLQGPPVEAVVIFEFETMEAAKAWYDSPAYREAREHQFKGAEYRVFVSKGR
jgi:uncharacterized protein (DUF1330 family)